MKRRQEKLINLIKYQENSREGVDTKAGRL
jgi:hypothetical protein